MTQMDQVSHQRLHVGILHPLAGAFTKIMRRPWIGARDPKGPLIVKKVCGVLVLVAGLYLIYRA